MISILNLPTFLPSLYNMKLMHVRDVCFDGFPLTSDICIMSYMKKKIHQGSAKALKIALVFVRFNELLRNPVDLAGS